MRRLFLLSGLVCLGLSIARPSLAQRDSLKLQDLAMPTSPAFSLLDQAPTIVDRPSSARAVAVGLFQSINQSTGLPTNYAAEFTPYWFVKHRKMSFYRYYGTNGAATRTVAGPGVLIPRAAFSLAFVNPTTSGASNTTQPSTFSFGGRIPLFKKVYQQDLLDLQEQTKAVTQSLRQLEIEFQRQHPEAMVLLTTGKPEDLVRFHTLEREFIAQAKYKAKGDVSEVLSRRPAAVIDLAFAGSRYFPNTTFASNRAGRVGVWLTASGSTKARKDSSSAKNSLVVSYYLIGRFLSDQTRADTTRANTYLDLTYLDGGGKLELAIDKLAFSYELVARKVGGANKDRNPTVGSGWRSVGNIKYQIGQNVFLTGAFGKNFGVRENLLYTLGINWNIQVGTEQAYFASK